MQYRKLGKTDLEVSVVGFGAIKLPEVRYEEAELALNRALDLGINFVDTARAYHDSERKIGKALKSRRDEYYLATKTVARDYEGAMMDLETSLRELQTDRVDILQLHAVGDMGNYNRATGSRGALEAAKKALEQGKIRHIGISIHRALPVMRKAIESGEFETIMLAYSILDQENVGLEIIPLAKKHEVGVIIMKSLSGGLLASPLTSEERKKIDFDPIVRGSLRYVVSNENISVVIPGMRNVKEVEENVAVGSMEKISETELRELREKIGKLGISFRYGQVCQRCGYCQPCEQGVNIPVIFMAYDMYKSYPANLKYLGLEKYNSLEVKPDACIECGECESKCPAGIPIMEKLKEVASFFVEVQQPIG